jgi:hypothetical protein
VLRRGGPIVALPTAACFRPRRPESHSDPAGRIVCVISGGNIDATKLVRILDGEVPA